MDAGGQWVDKVEEERDNERDRIPRSDFLEPSWPVVVGERWDLLRWGQGNNLRLLLLVGPAVVKGRVVAIRIDRRVRRLFSFWGRDLSVQEPRTAVR